jgi:hypothetical protein
MSRTSIQWWCAPRPWCRQALDPLLEELEERTFNFFWDTAEPGTGLIPDRWPRPPFSSIAAVGFALNAYAIGVERGYVTAPPPVRAC